MTLRLVTVILLSLCLWACSDSQDRADARSAPDEASLPPEEIDAAAAAALAALSRPAIPAADLNRLNDYLVEVIGTLMVQGADAVSTNDITRRLLDLLEEEQLLALGRPEGVVRDKVIRIKEDMDAFRPPGSLGKELSERQQNNLRLLGKLYAEDLRKKFSPEGANPKLHEGFLRQVPAIPEGRLQSGYEALTWKRIGSFVFDKQKKILPAEILALNDQRVAICGFLMPAAEFDDIHEFLLVDSLWTCCFGEAPAVNQVIIVKIDKSKKGIPYYRDPILVHGVFDVGVEESEGWVTSVYRLQADAIETITLK